MIMLWVFNWWVFSLSICGPAWKTGHSNSFKCVNDDSRQLFYIGHIFQLQEAWPIF